MFLTRIIYTFVLKTVVHLVLKHPWDPCCSAPLFQLRYSYNSCRGGAPCCFVILFLFPYSYLLLRLCKAPCCLLSWCIFLPMPAGEGFSVALFFCFRWCLSLHIWYPLVCIPVPVTLLVSFHAGIMFPIPVPSCAVFLFFLLHPYILHFAAYSCREGGSLLFRIPVASYVATCSCRGGLSPVSFSCSCCFLFLQGWAHSCSVFLFLLLQI